MTYQETAYPKTNIVDANGNVINSFGGSGGGGDASSTNQQSQIQLETAIRDRIGNTSITGTTMPAGGAGLFGWLSAIWQLISDRTIKGANTSANSLSITLATDGIFAVFAGVASDAASITGSIHAKLNAIASTQYSNWNRLQNASDLNQTYTYLDSGTSDERINTVVYSSVSSSLTITETYAYSGSAGAYSLSNIVRS